MLSERAPAKINLALHVVGRRADGYHLLDTLVVFAGTGDTLRALSGDPALAASAEDAPPRLEASGPFAAGVPTDGRNLIFHAADALFAAAGLGLGARPALRLQLDKVLPIASGIGGGSADAAAALRLINRLLGLGLETARLAAIAAPLGADVPMCVYSRSLRARGIGEEISLFDDLPRLDLVLANPGFSLATSAVFAAREGEEGAGLGEIPRYRESRGLAAWLSGLRNDLQQAACRLAPPVGAALEAMAAQPGCLLARMSGSGATVFGIFADGAAARAAEAEISRAEPGWWVRATRTL